MNIELLHSQKPIPRRVLYVDMNSFFASVEQEIKPHLRGQPVGVCPFLNDATCVIAASLEAKRYGVVTGTRVADARRLCPGIHLMSDDPAVYRTYHHRIVAALETTRCQVHVRSIDEAALTLPADLRPQAIETAHEVAQLIHQVGSQLGCSIGIASNTFLAKMGSRLHKPRGLVEVGLDDLEALYASLELTDLYGVSWRLARRLEAIGISSTLEFYHAPHELLKRTFGVNGERWYLRLRGYEVDQQPTRRRSIGHQTTIVPEPARSRTEVASVANQLCYKAATRLRAADMAAGGVVVAVRHTDRSYWSDGVRTAAPFWDSDSFFALTKQVLSGWPAAKPARLVSVTAVHLVPQNALTMPLLPLTQRSERLSTALDEIDRRFGRQTVAPAIQMLSRRINDRVGFGNAGQAPGPQ